MEAPALGQFVPVVGCRGTEANNLDSTGSLLPAFALIVGGVRFEPFLRFAVITLVSNLFSSETRRSQCLWTFRAR